MLRGAHQQPGPEPFPQPHGLQIRYPWNKERNGAKVKQEECKVRRELHKRQQQRTSMKLLGRGWLCKGNVPVTVPSTFSLPCRAGAAA